MTVMPTKFTLSYCDFESALGQKWEGVKGRAMRRISTTLWSTLCSSCTFYFCVSMADEYVVALFAYQKENPTTPPTAETFQSTASSLLPTLFVDPALVKPSDAS